MNKITVLNTLAAVAGLMIASPIWATTAQIPEPNIITLLGIGVVSAILFTRYKIRK
ncbi:MAG: hypothetical protein H6995_07440 [Pseudomonadales bacterium]|nr:hypothetical protein [Pseudomonadales bacterium]MCP5214824.1 hypothetical protein [Pseudomonadales bacterium]